MRRIQVVTWAMLGLLCFCVNQAEAVRPAGLVPVFSRYGAGGEIFLTTDPREGDALGYSTPLVEFYAAPTRGGACPTGTTLLYRFTNPDGSHFFTSNPDERLNFINTALGGVFPADGSDRFVCIALLSDDPDRVPVFRYHVWNATQYYYIGTNISYSQCVSAYGCTDTTTLGFGWPVPTPYTVRNYAEAYQALDRPPPAGTGPGTIIPKQTPAGDSELTTVPLGFSFQYFGQNYSSVKVSTNGLLTFNPPTDDAADKSYVNTLFPPPNPGSTTPHNFIAGWWDHSVLLSASDFIYQTTGAPGQRVFTVQWGGDQWATYARPDVVRNMQIKLFEATGRIEVHYGSYKSTDPGKGPYATVDTASIGIGDPYSVAIRYFSTGWGSVMPFLRCMPKCGAADWPQDQVVAFMPEPKGFIANEKYPADSANPTNPADPGGYHALVDGAAGVTAIHVDGSGNANLLVPLPFTFAFDGQNFTSLGVSSKGVAALGHLPPSTVPAPIQRQIPPGSIAFGTPTANLIAPWWDDLKIDQSDGKNHLLYQVLPSYPATGKQVLIVEWQNLRHSGITDASARNVQLWLFEGTNDIWFYYGDDTYKDKSHGGTGITLDSASAGIMSADNDGRTVSFPLLLCTPNCNEGHRSRSGMGWDARNPGWPPFTRFEFTQDPEDAPTWHSVYWEFLMPAAYTPTGVTASAGHCGNCHASTFNWPEDKLYPKMFDAVRFPTEAAMGCGLAAIDAGYWGFSTLSSFASVLDPIVDPNQTAVTWMTEPRGGFGGNEGNMPYNVHCATKDPDANSNDIAKSRIKRWLMQ